MEVDTNNFGDWVNTAFEALSDSGEKWPAFGNAPSFPQHAFTIPPSLLTHSSIQRFGQITPPEELSPAEPCDSARESSIPLDQLKNEALVPDHEIQAIQNYQPQLQALSDHPPQKHQLQRSPKRRRTARQTAVNRPQVNPASIHPQQDSGTPQPKRKRGRPKSTPQMIEAFTADGYHVPVSSTRESHLEKNRVAAHKCRQRKKEYINGLEGRAREYTAKNKALRENVAMLREEVLGLKNEVLHHAGCGFWAVDEYLARCAGDLLGMEAPVGAPGSRKLKQTHSHVTTTQGPEQLHRESSAESPPSQGTTNSPDDEDFGGLDLLQDFDEEMKGQDS